MNFKILFLSFLCFPILGKAQISFGIQGEIGKHHAKFKTNGTVAGNGISKSDGLVGFSIAPFIGIPVLEKHFFLFETSYSLKGYRFKLSNFFDLETAISRNTFHYLGINSVYLHNLISGEKKRRNKQKKLYLISGFHYNYNLHSKWKSARSSVDSDQTSFKKIDIGFILGMRFLKHISRKRAFSFDIRYYHSLTNIAIHPFIDMYNRGLVIGASYVFITQKKKQKTRK